MTTMPAIPLLGAILVERGRIRPEMLQRALQAQRECAVRPRLGQVLVQLGYISEQDLHDAVLAQRGLADEVSRLISSSGDQGTLLLVARSEITELALRAVTAHFPYQVVRIEEAALSGRAQGTDVKAVLWEIDPADASSTDPVQAWRRACPRQPLVALVDEDCPARFIERLSQSGADQVLVLPPQEVQVTRSLQQAMVWRQVREQLEQQQVQLERLERVLASLEPLGLLLNGTLDSATIGSELASEVTSILEVEAGLVQWDGRRTILTGARAGCLQHGLSPGLQGVLDWCRRTNGPVRLDDPRRHPLWEKMNFDLPGLRIRSLLCMPLLANGESMGGIAVMNRLDGREFSAQDQRILTLMAGEIGLALENARLRATVEQLVREDRCARVA